MTYNELLADIKEQIEVRKELGLGNIGWSWNALRAVVELHSPTNDGMCKKCLGLSADYVPYPCTTVQAIEKELR